MQQLFLARDHSTFFHLGERFWRLDGRILTDVWWAVRAEMRPKQETLDYVAKHLLGVGKHELQRRKIDEEWEADRDKVIRYCINDAELSLKILERVRRIEKTLDLAAVSKLPLEDVLHGRTSNLIDSILIRAADRAHVAVPMMKMRGGRVEQIEGGYVHSLQRGLYEWVISLDFRAMYPSLIIENNICFTTVSPNGTIASPTGAKFLAADVKKGLLPVILANLMKDRQEVRSRMKAETDPQMKDFYEGLQAAIKILMNAFYGVLASSFYRFNDPKVGASITAFARDRIKGIIGELEAEQVKVVYADTDSVFFQSPSPGPGVREDLGSGPGRLDRPGEADRVGSPGGDADLGRPGPGSDRGARDLPDGQGGESLREPELHEQRHRRAEARGDGRGVHARDEGLLDRDRFQEEPHGGGAVRVRPSLRPAAGLGILRPAGRADPRLHHRGLRLGREGALHRDPAGPTEISRQRGLRPTRGPSGGPAKAREENDA